MNFREDYITPALFAWDKRALFGNYFNSLLSVIYVHNIIYDIFIYMCIYLESLCK